MALQALEEEKYWTTANLAEALIALGDKSGNEILKEAIGNAPADWMAAITLSQLEKLPMLLGQHVT
jgi:hypothetical protein